MGRLAERERTEYAAGRSPARFGLFVYWDLRPRQLLTYIHYEPTANIEGKGNFDKRSKKTKTHDGDYDQGVEPCFTAIAHSG